MYVCFSITRRCSVDTNTDGDGETVYIGLYASEGESTICTYLIIVLSVDGILEDQDCYAFNLLHILMYLCGSIIETTRAVFKGPPFLTPEFGASTT